MKKNLYILFLFFNGILLILTSCPSYPTIPTTSIPNTQPLVLTSATNGMAAVTSSSRQMSLSVTEQIDEACPSGSNWNIFSLTITPKGETEKEIMKVYLSCDTMTLYWGGDLFLLDLQLSYIPYKPYKTFSVVVTIDLYKGAAWIESNTGNEYASNGITFSVDPSWTFDKTTKIYLCSGTDGAASAVDCTVSRLQVSTETTSILGNLVDFTPVSKGFYPLNDGPSTDLLSTVISASSGYFGDSPLSSTAGTSPTWDSSNSFVKIASQTQFLTFPLPLIPEDPVLVTSMTVSMWLRISSIPASTTTIFSIFYADRSMFLLNSSTSNTVRLIYRMSRNERVKGRTAYSLKATQSNLGLAAYFKGSKMYSENNLGVTLNTWQLISFSIYLPPSSTSYLRAKLFVDDTSTILETSNPSGEFLSATEFRVGDATTSFIGDVSAVRILSPGIGNLTTTGLCDSDSAIQIGFGPYSLSCSNSGSFNPYNNKCYASCPVETITLGTDAPSLSLCLTEEPEKEPTPGGTSVITVEESGGLSSGAIVGIVVGSLFGLLFLIIVGYVIRKHCMKSYVKSGVKRRKTEENELSTPKKPLTGRSNMVSPTVEEEIAL